MIKRESNNERTKKSRRISKANVKDFFSSSSFYIVLFSVLILILISLSVTIYFSLSLSDNVTYMQKKAFDIFTDIIYTGFTALIGLMVGKFAVGNENLQDE